VTNKKIHTKLFTCLLLTFTISSCILSASESQLDSQNYGPILIDEIRLSKVKERLNEQDTVLYKIRQSIIEEADKFLLHPPLSVVNNGKLPTSGNPHDYRSIARYWWPNSETESGLPYEYRDGKVNPEIYDTDWNILSKFSTAVWKLSLAYYFSDNEQYAKKARELLRYWFIDENTYMAPNMKYGQAIPGISEGTPSGIIETISFLKVIDGVSLIYSSQAWTKQDHLQLKVWFSTYLDWLLYSTYGAGASNQENNHSTWFEVQVSAYALFVGRETIARRRSNDTFSNNIYSQINYQGAQPLELNRVNSQDYVSFNMLGILNMVSLAKDADDNLFQKRPDVIRRVKQGLEWLKPFASGDKKWSMGGGAQTKEYNLCNYVEIYRKAAIEFEEPSYEELVQNLILNGCTDKVALLVYPKPDFN